MGDERGGQAEAKVAASMTEICELSAETKRSRVKVLRRGDVGIKPGSITVGLVFVVGMTSGDVEVWHFTGDDENPACNLLRVVETSARLTCLTAWCCHVKGEKAESNKGAESGEDEEGIVETGQRSRKGRKRSQRAVEGKENTVEGEGKESTVEGEETKLATHRLSTNKRIKKQTKKEEAKVKLGSDEASEVEAAC